MQFLLSNVLITETCLVHFCFWFFFGILWYFQAGKNPETSPTDATDHFRCAAGDFSPPCSPMASLSSFSPRCPSWRELSTPKRQDFCKPKMFITRHSLLVAGAGLAMGGLTSPALPPAAARRVACRCHRRGRGCSARPGSEPSAAAALETLETFYMYCLIETKETISAPTSSATNCSI